MTATPGNTFIMAVHTIDTLTGLCEHKFVYTFLADLAVETVGMISIVTGHDGFVENREAADIAAVGTVGAYGGTVR